MPISDDVVQKKWLDLAARADPRIDTEIFTAMVERDEKFTAWDIPCLKEILDCHTGAKPLNLGLLTFFLFLGAEKPLKRNKRMLSGPQLRYFFGLVASDCFLGS